MVLVSFSMVDWLIVLVDIPQTPQVSDSFIFSILKKTEGSPFCWMHETIRYSILTPSFYSCPPLLHTVGIVSISAVQSQFHPYLIDMQCRN